MKKNGFTFVELMIIVGIIGLLLAILIPSYSNEKQKQINSISIEKTEQASSILLNTNLPRVIYRYNLNHSIYITRFWIPDQSTGRYVTVFSGYRTSVIED